MTQVDDEDYSAPPLHSPPGWTNIDLKAPRRFQEDFQERAQEVRHHLDWTSRSPMWNNKRKGDCTSPRWVTKFLRCARRFTRTTATPSSLRSARRPSRRCARPSSWPSANRSMRRSATPSTQAVQDWIHTGISKLWNNSIASLLVSTTPNISLRSVLYIPTAKWSRKRLVQQRERPSSLNLVSIRINAW